MGDMLGFPKGAIVNLVVRKVKKMVPAYSLPEAVQFKAALAEGKGKPLNTLRDHRGGRGVPAIHRRHHRRVEGRDAAPPQHRGERAAERCLAAAALSKEPKVDQLLIVTALPLYHIFALTRVLPAQRSRRGLLSAHSEPARHSEPREGIAEVQGQQIPGGEHALQRAAQSPRLRQDRLLAAQGVERRRHGGADARSPSAGSKATGCPIIEGYGLSETSPVLTCNRGDNNEFTGTIGLPVPSTEISIRDEAGNEMPLGEPGEICARGPQVMAGYWQRPGRNRAGDDKGRLLPHRRHRRDGRSAACVKIVDRKKDMVLVSGFNVYPNEVEDVLAMHPGVLECAVIGVPDAASGEAVKAYIVRRDPALTEEEVKRFVAEQLTGYKRPKIIEFRDELPKTLVGKILRRALRDELTKTQKAA